MNRKKAPRPEEYVQEALDELVELGCDEQVLRSLAISLVVLKPRTERRRLQRLLQEFNRMQRDLRRYSQVADSMDRINGHLILGTAAMRRAWGLDSPGSALFPIFTQQQEGILNMVKMREALPNEIRFCVEDINKRIRDLKRVFHLKGSGPGRDSLKFALIAYVRRSTGQPNYNLVSALLSAFEGDAPSAEFIPENLQVFEGRCRQRMQSAAMQSRASNRK
jgi:hypothetical protein